MTTETMLTEPAFTLIILGVKSTGSFEPEEALGLHMEEFTFDHYAEATEFLSWVVKNELTFGHNIEEVYRDFWVERHTANINSTTEKS